MYLRLAKEETLKYRCICRSPCPRAEKFNIVINDHGRTHKRFFRFRPEIPFWGKFCSKNQNCQLLTFFCFGLETLFLDKFDPKNQNSQLKLNLVVNLVPKVTRIHRYQWLCSRFLFYTGKTLFGKRKQRKGSYCLCDRTKVETLK